MKKTLIMLALCMSALCLPLCVSMCSDIIWMLSSDDNAIPPWGLGDCEGCFLPDDEDAQEGPDLGTLNDERPGPQDSSREQQRARVHDAK